MVDRDVDAEVVEEDRRSTGSDRKVVVTGGSSLLGRLVVAELLRRGGAEVLAVLRSSSAYTERTLAEALGESGDGDLPGSRLTVLLGDVLEPDLGLGAEVHGRLQGATEIIHLARPRADEESPPDALAEGLDRVVDLARRLGTIRRLVVLSSTDVVGDYSGRFYEDWLDIGQSLNTQSSRDNCALEQRARKAGAYVPVCIARHAMLVGSTETGEIECDAGFARLLAWGARAARLPSFVRPWGPAAGERFVTVSPVDFVAAGLVELAFNDQVKSAETFCLADGAPPTLSELFDLVLHRVGGPTPGFRLPVEGKGPVGRSIELVARLGATLTGTVSEGPGIWGFLIQRGDHDVSNAMRILEPVGIRCPRLETYYDALYEDFRRRQGRF